MKTCRTCPNWRVADPSTAIDGDCRAITSMVTTPFLGSVLTTQAAFGCVMHPEARVERGRPSEDALTAHARNEDPGTSHEAAASLTRMKLTKNRIAVLRLMFLANQPMTDRKIAEFYRNHGLPEGFPVQGPSGLRTRRSELVTLGYVEAGGILRPEKGPGHTLWQLTEAGRTKAGEVLTNANTGG